MIQGLKLIICSGKIKFPDDLDQKCCNGLKMSVVLGILQSSISGDKEMVKLFHFLKKYVLHVCMILGEIQ